jgi:hypothetical protein
MAVGLVVQLEHGDIERRKTSPIQPGKSGPVCECAVSITTQSHGPDGGRTAEQDHDEAKGITCLCKATLSTILPDASRRKKRSTATKSRNRIHEDRMAATVKATLRMNQIHRKMLTACGKEGSSAPVFVSMYAPIMPEPGKMRQAKRSLTGSDQEGQISGCVETAARVSQGHPEVRPSSI